MVHDTNKKRLMFNNFLGGLAWGVGTVVGATLIVGIVGWILTTLGILPFFSQFFPSK